jgi:FtsH-binding integral membrane protein
MAKSKFFMFAAILLWFASSFIEFLYSGSVTSLMSVISSILFTVAIITEEKNGSSRSTK